jgi:hypothetical protein
VKALVFKREFVPAFFHVDKSGNHSVTKHFAAVIRRPCYSEQRQIKCPKEFIIIVIYKRKYS